MRDVIAGADGGHAHGQPFRQTHHLAQLKSVPTAPLFHGQSVIVSSHSRL